MAILTGFPPSNTISPSVRITEKDLSYIAASQSFHRAGLVGFCSKGPINVPTLISSTRQLHTVFGYAHPESSDPYLIYAAEQYLLVGTELFIVRVADTDAVSDESAATAEVTIPGAGGSVLDISSVASSSPFIFSKNMYFRWRVNGVLRSKVLMVPVNLSGYTAAELAAELNSQLDAPITDGMNDGSYDGIRFQVSTGGKLEFYSTRSFGPDASIELVSVQDQMYGPSSIFSGGDTGLGMGENMEVAETLGANDFYPNDGYHTSDHYNFDSLSSLSLAVVVDGTNVTSIDNVVQILDLSDLIGMGEITSTTIVNAINALNPLGCEAYASAGHIGFRTLHAGRDARILVKSAYNYAIFGFDGTTAVGVSPEGSSGDIAVNTYAIIDGNDVAGDSLTITADTAGIEGNNTTVRITNNTNEGTFNIEVFSNGVQVESWGMLTKYSASSYYVQTFLALVSDYIRCIDIPSEPAPPANGDYVLTGGADGIPSSPEDQDALLRGSDVGYTGMYALSEPEQIDIDLIAVPGHSSTGVILELLSMCQNYRQDCLAIIDPPFGLTVSEIIDWQNGVHPLNLTRLDSDFGALYWPWVKIYDGNTGVDVWVPPSGSVMAVMARSDTLGAPWFAPAGMTRGQVPGIIDVFNRPTLEERDSMYGNSNCINPIIQFPDTGYLVWGQKTMQRTPTALDRVNVRRLMFYIEKKIRVASRTLLFEPNDEIFRTKFINMAKGILSEVRVGRGLYDFIIKADTELNTPDVIDRNEFRAQIGVQPTKSVEFMFIEFSIHRTGSFDAGSTTF